MKLLTLALLSLVSVSSFASTVRCDIYKFEKNQTVTPVDYFLLGNVNGKNVWSVNKQVEGLENTYVYAGLEKNTFISVKLTKGDIRVDKNAEFLIDAGVDGSGFQIRNQEAEVAVTCGTYTN